MIFINSDAFKLKLIKIYFLWLAIAFMTVFILKNPNAVINSVKYGLSLCAKTVIPSLFPFMVLSNLVIDSGLYRVPSRILAPFCRYVLGVNGNCSTALILGAFSGFPVGAKTAVNLYKKDLCSKDEAERIISYCNNAGPGFLISCVGLSLLSDIGAGRILYTAQLMSAVICGIILRLIYGSAEKKKYIADSSENNDFNFNLGIIPQAVGAAGTSIISICAFIVFFSVFVDMISGIFTAFSMPPTVNMFIIGMIELVSGAEAAVKFGNMMPLRTLMTLLGAFTGFSGISVHMQVILFSAGSGLSLKKYIIGKLIQSIICAAILFCIYSFI